MKAMKAWKGLLVAVLLLCSFLCVASVNTSAVSAAGEHTHPICGKTHTDIGDHTAAKCETVTYTAWDGTFASSGMPDIDYSNNDTAYVYLTRSVEITYELEIPKGKTLYLCLNGYTIKKTEMSDTWSAVILSRSGDTHFILCDCKGGGTITHADGVLGRGVRSGNSDGYDKSSFTMYGAQSAATDSTSLLEELLSAMTEPACSYKAVRLQCMAEKSPTTMLKSH